MSDFLSPSVTLTSCVRKHKVHKLHPLLHFLQVLIFPTRLLFTGMILITNVKMAELQITLVEFMYLLFTCMLGELPYAAQVFVVVLV